MSWKAEKVPQHEVKTLLELTPEETMCLQRILEEVDGTIVRKRLYGSDMTFAPVSIYQNTEILVESILKKIMLVRFQ
jgi:hypothetical protein